MRIAIEVFGTQSESRFRGVGRYTYEFVNALLDLGTRHEFLLYAQEGAPTDYIPGKGRVDVRWLQARPFAGRADALRRLPTPARHERRRDRHAPAHATPRSSASTTCPRRRP